MVSFRKMILAFAVLAVFAGLASAQITGTNINCAANVSVTPALRAEGYTEQTGDIVLTCTGGIVQTPGAQIPQVNITIALNTQVTSRLLPVSGNSTNISEALLMINEPGSALPGVGPALGQKLCPTPNTGCIEYVSTVAGPGIPVG